MRKSNSKSTRVRMKSALLAIFVIVVFLVAGTPAEAKVLAGRIGLGFNAQIDAVASAGAGLGSLTAQSISVKYWINDAIGIQLLTGFGVFHVEDLNRYRMNAAGKFLYNLIQEQNLNFYLGGGLGLIVEGWSGDGDADSDLGIALFGGAGFEWFFQGLPNLGFDAEVGLQYAYLDETSSFGSYGGAFAIFGIHYYF